MSKIKIFDSVFERHRINLANPKFTIAIVIEMMDDAINSYLSSITDIGEAEKRPTYNETFTELRKIMSPYWDNVKCVCNELMRDRCELNCAEYESDPAEVDKKEKLRNSTNTNRAIGLIEGVIQGIQMCGKGINLDGVVSVLLEVKEILDPYK